MRIDATPVSNVSIELVPTNPFGEVIFMKWSTTASVISERSREAGRYRVRKESNNLHFYIPMKIDENADPVILVIGGMRMRSMFDILSGYDYLYKP